MPVIWVSRSMRSTTIRIVGLVSSAIARSFSAVNTISSDLPEPWKCQIRPCLILPEQHPLDDQVGRLELLEARDDLDLAVLLVRRVEREEPQEVQHRARLEDALDGLLDGVEPDLGRCVLGRSSSSRHGPHSSTGIPTVP